MTAAGIPTCVMFDAGRVLLDIDFGNLAAYLKTRAGLEPDEVREAVAGDSLARSYELGLLTDDEFCSRICRRLGVEIPREELVEAWNSVIQDPIVPEEMLAALSARSALWVVSNTNNLHFAHILKQYPYLKYFRGYVLSFQSGIAKPNPDIFRLALARAGAKAEESLFIDDQSANVTAARTLGIDGIQFLNPGQLAVDLRSRGLL